ncbi:MAG: prepilin-type N-terminal cleavage/methylation domain-containing protein [Methylococcales bacterium]
MAKRILVPKESHHGAEHGFTLIEIMIGLVLLSIMMTLLFGSIRMGARAWDGGEKRAAEIDTMLVVENFLRKHLSTARPVFDDFSNSDEPVFSFSGTDDSIQFVSNLPSSARLGGFHQFNLELVKEGDSLVLVAKLKPFYPALNGDYVSIEDVRLIGGVDSLEWSYYESDKIDPSEGRWTDAWVDKNSMPVLIQLIVRMKNGGEWPAMIVNPKLVSNQQDLSYNAQ